MIFVFRILFGAKIEPDRVSLLTADKWCTHQLFWSLCPQTAPRCSGAVRSGFARSACAGPYKYYIIPFLGLILIRKSRRIYDGIIVIELQSVINYIKNINVRNTKVILLESSIHYNYSFSGVDLRIEYRV